MEDTWTWRDLPVLDAAVSQLDEMSAEGLILELADIAEVTGLAVNDVIAAVEALEGEYLGLQRTMGDPARWRIWSVTSAARREVGQWPTGESLIKRLVGGISEAAERETDPERKRRLAAVARELGGMAKAVAVNVASQVLGHQLPH
jgi:hypothetical protein